MNGATAMFAVTGKTINVGKMHFFKIYTCYPPLFGNISKFFEHKFTIIIVSITE